MQKIWTNIKADILTEIKANLQTEPNFNANEAVDLFLKIVSDSPNLSEFKNALIFNPDDYAGRDFKTARTVLGGKLFENYIKTIFEILSFEINGELKVCLVEFFKRFNFPARPSLPYYPPQAQRWCSVS